MSVALSSHINSLKELLIDCKDSASKARHRLTDERLTTLFTPSEPEVRGSAPRNLEHDQLGLSPSQIKRARVRAQAVQAKSSNQMLMGGKLLDPEKPEVLGHIKAQYKTVMPPPPLPPVPADFHTASKYKWSVGDIAIVVNSDDGADANGPPMYISSCSWVQRHLSKHRPQDVFLGDTSTLCLLNPNSWNF